MDAPTIHLGIQMPPRSPHQYPKNSGLLPGSGAEVSLVICRILEAIFSMHIAKLRVPLPCRKAG
ncbi:hypothetical protein BJX65DRAFT_260500 [Aspergillus insuetus]